MAGLNLRIDPAPLIAFRKDLKRLAPDIRKELDRELRAAAKEVAATAKANASWSTRIPAAIGVSVTGKVVAVKAREVKAPHARPYEGIGGQGSFRHPVFGDRQVWVSQATRPFIAPAAKEHEADFYRRVEDAVDRAAAKAGFR